LVVALVLAVACLRRPGHIVLGHGLRRLGRGFGHPGVRGSDDLRDTVGRRRTCLRETAARGEEADCEQYCRHETVAAAVSVGRVCLIHRTSECTCGARPLQLEPARVSSYLIAPRLDAGTRRCELRGPSAGLLASAGISGLIVGFAARSTLGNAVAGVTIAFAQPIRIGDEIELRGERGSVEDITLLYTVVRLWDGKRLIVPNDTLS